MKAVKMLPSFAWHWARELGGVPNSLERLKGGINNQVFRCGDGKRKWIIKGYAPPQNGQSDRMQAEQQFLQFASEVAPGFTPALIHSDPVLRCVILENIEGKSFTEGIAPQAAAVEEATKFIYLLNSAPEIGRDCIKLDAAEGFLSLRQHIANVNGRLQAMSWDHLPKDDRKSAERLIMQTKNKHDEIKEEIDSLITGGLITDWIRTEQRCISPSDFGFHNAIETPSGIRFFDFEFAGWDDPAKTTLDFILQPRIPVVGFGSPLLSAWRPEVRDVVKERCDHLKPVLQLKWVCILLSILNPDRLIQIQDNIIEEEKNLLIQNRLRKAEELIALLDK